MRRADFPPTDQNRSQFSAPAEFRFRMCSWLFFWRMAWQIDHRLIAFGLEANLLRYLTQPLIACVPGAFAGGLGRGPFRALAAGNLGDLEPRNLPAGVVRHLRVRRSFR